VNRRGNDGIDTSGTHLESLLCSLPPLSPPPRLAAEVRRRVEPLAAARRAAATDMVIRRMWLCGLLLLVIAAAGTGGALWALRAGIARPSAGDAGLSPHWWQPWQGWPDTLWSLANPAALLSLARETLADWAAGLAERLTIWRCGVLNLVLAWRRLASSAGSWPAPWLMGLLLAYFAWVLGTVYALTRMGFTPRKSN